MRALACLLLAFLLVAGSCRQEASAIAPAPRAAPTERAPPPRNTAPPVALEAARPVEPPPPPAAAEHPHAQAQPAQTGPSAECADAKDCEVVRVGCCDCSGMGKHRAIAKSQRADYDKRLLARCGPRSKCLAAMSPHMSCHMIAGCRGGKCVLVLPKN
jgi:hypothetical protein